MSRTIDQQVVEMQFDNSNFERNVKQSMSTLDKLKSKISFNSSAKAVSKDMNNIQNSVNNVSFKGMEKGIESLQNRFSVMGIVSMRIIERLTDAAITLGRRLYQNTIGQIKSGGLSRALNIEEAQFQLRGLLRDAGNIDDAIKEIMDDVNYGVQDTAYGLDEAAKVASQLVASGLTAGDEMKSVLRGISGVAAMTNSTYSDIGEIFTTVASNGKLMTEQLRQFSFRGLNVSAVLAKSLNTTEENVNEMVSKGKIDFKTFAEAMDEAFGEHAKDANQTFTGAMSNIRAALSRTGAAFYSPIIKDNGPLVKFLNTIRNKINDINKLLSPLATTSTDFINKVITGLTNIVEKMDMNKIKKPIDALTNAFKKLNEMKFDGKMNSFKMAFSGVGKFAKQASDQIHEFCNQLFSVNSIVNHVSSGIGKLKDFFAGLSSTLTNDLNFNLKKFAKLALGLFAAIKVFKLDRVLSGWPFQILQTIRPFFSVAKSISGFLKTLSLQISKTLLDIDLKSLRDFALTLFILAGALALLASIDAAGLVRATVALSVLFKMLTTYYDKIKASTKNASISSKNPITDGLLSMFENVKQFFQRIGDITVMLGMAASILLLAKSMQQIAKMDWKGMTEGLVGVSVLISEMAIVFKQISKITDKYDTKGLAKSMFGLIEFTLAIKLLVTSVRDLGEMDTDKAIQGLAGVSTLILELGVVAKTMSKVTTSSKSKGFNFNEKNSLAKGMFGLIEFALAIRLLVNSVKSIGSMDSNAAVQGMAGVSLLIGELTLSAKLLQNNSSSFNKSIGSIMLLIGFAESIRILVKQVKVIGDMEPESAIPGLIGVSILIGEMSLTINQLNNIDSKGAVFKVISLIGFGAAITLLTKSVKDIGNMDINKEINGLVGISLLIGEMMLVVKKLNSLNYWTYTKNTIGNVFALIEFAAAMRLLADAMKVLSDIGLSGILEGLATIGASLLIFVKTVKAIDSMSQSIKSAASIVIIAEAMKILATAMNDMSGLSLSQVAINLTAIGVSLLEFCLALKSLDKLGNNTLKNSAAIFVLSMAMRELSEAVSVLSKLSIGGAIKGLLTLGAALGIVVGVAKLASKLSVPIFGLSLAIIAVCSALSAMLSLCKLSNTEISGLGDKLKMVSDQLGKAMPELTKTLVTGLMQSIKEALIQTRNDIGEIVSMLFDIAVTVINVLATRIPELVGPITNLVKGIVKLIVDVFNNLTSDMDGEEFFELGKTLLEACFAFAALSLVAPEAMEGVLAFGAVIGELMGVLAVLGLIQKMTGVSWFIKEGSKVADAIGHAIGSFIGNIIGGFANGMSSDLPAIGQNLGQFMINAQPFFDGCKSITPDTLAGVKTLADVAKQLAVVDILSGNFGIFGPLKKLIDSKLNLTPLTYFAQQLPALGRGIYMFSNSISGIDSESMDVGIKAIKKLVKIYDILEGGTSVGTRFAESLTGTNSMYLFSRNLPGLGRSLTQFSNSAQGIDEKNISVAISATKKLAKLNNEIAPDGFTRLMNMMTGHTSLAEFGIGLATFGKGIKSFNDSLGSEPMNNANIDSAIDAGMSLAKLSKRLPEKNIFGFTKYIDFRTFSPGIKAFGEGIKSFNDSVQNGKSNLDEKKMDSAVAIGIKLADLAKKLPEKNIFGFTKNIDFNTFGPGLEALGKGIREFNDSLFASGSSGHDMDEGKLNSAISIIEKLAAIKMPKKNFFGQSKDIDFSQFGKTLGDLATGIVSFNNILASSNNLDEGRANIAISIIEKLAAIKMPKKNFFGQSKDIDFSQFGKTLGDLGKGITAFNNELSKGDTKLNSDNINVAVNALTGISRIVKELDNIQPNNSFANYGSGGMDSFITFISELKPLGKNIKAFSDELGDKALNIANITTGIDIINKISDLATKITGIKGLTNIWTGGNFSSFIDILPAIGQRLKTFSDNIGKDALNVDNMNQSVSILNNLAPAVQAISQAKGLGGFHLGPSPIDAFTSALPKIGTAIKDFNASIADGINVDACNNVINVGTGLANMVATISQTKGLGGISSLLGINPIDAFVSKLPQIGTAISSFSNNVASSGINVEACNNAISVGQSLANMVAAISGTQGLGGFNLSMLTGVDPISTFVHKVPKIGAAIAKFSASISDGIDVEACNNAVVAGSQLANLVSTISSIEGLGGFHLGQSPIDAFTSALPKIGTAMSSFSNNIGDGYGEKNIESINNAVASIQQIANICTTLSGIDPTALSSFATGLKDLATADINGFVQAFQDGGERAKAAVTSMLKVALSGATTGDVQSLARSKGRQLIYWVDGGIKSKRDDVSASVKYALGGATKAIRSKRDAFYTAGAYVMKGLAQGITDNGHLAIAAAASVAQKIKDIVARTKFEEQSPSKYFRRVGQYVSQGLAIGILQDASTAFDAAENLADGVIDTTNGLDISPKITPVIDMTNGFDRIGQFAKDINIPLTGKIDSINETIESYTKEIVNSNNEVISSIEGLRKDIFDYYENMDFNPTVKVGDKELTTFVERSMTQKMIRFNQMKK